MKTEIKTGEKLINIEDIKNPNINNNILKISVIDTGLGLNEEEIKNIFNSEKSFSKKDYNKEGSGLGLSICKNIEDMLKHEIEVSSVLACGSEFSLNLDFQFPNLGKKKSDFYNVKENSNLGNCSNLGIEIDSNNSRINDEKHAIEKNSNNKSYLGIKQTSSLQDISICSDSSYQTQVIKDQSFYIDKEKFFKFDFIENLKTNIYPLEKSFKINYHNNDSDSSDSKNLSKIILINNKDNENLNYNRNSSNRIKKYTIKEKLTCEQSNFINVNLESEKSNSKNFSDIQSNNNSSLISGIDPNKIIHNKEIDNTFNNNLKNNMKEDFLFKKKILVVDDNKIVRDSIVFLVIKCINLFHKENEFEIIEGRDGIDILYNIINDQSNYNEIKCVITDENMEYLNGSEAIHIIRNLEKNKKIKNIVIGSISAFQDEFNLSKIKSSGTDRILQKPCTVNIIKDFLTEYKIL